MWMKKKSWFSSKKVSKLRKNNKSEKVIRPESNDIFENQEIKENLKSFYDKEAKKYTETRKKFWHEEKVILDEITPLFEEWKKVRVLEFWCGSGRFATLLNQNFAGKFDYVGIDFSEKLLSYASKENPNLTFFQWDITKLIKNFEQESFDLIVWTSSFQHIPTTKERSFLMKNFYRLLDYDWTLLMTNWSLSKWFIKKHKNLVLRARIISWLKLNKWSSRDLMVPWTDADWIVYERFYHFFSLEELKNLANFSWLTLKVNTFIDGDGNFTDNEKMARSSLFVATKTPITN
jgi:SAM-dependent methyltransferase